MKLFFDTETTGVPKNYRAPVTDLDNWPRLVQIGWILYDDMGNLMAEQEMIVKPDGFEIPETAFAVHGISTEQATAEGVPLAYALRHFSVDCDMADAVIGHNVEFDVNVVGAEFIRAELPNPITDRHIYDTMKLSTEYCQIPGPYGFKWPKLSELYAKLFEADMGHAHTALADIQNTAKCFYKLVELEVIKV